MPAVKATGQKGKYNNYPKHLLEDGKIEKGFERLAEEFAEHRTVLIDHSRVERKDKHNYLSFQPPHQTVHAVFPHTAFL